MKVPMKELVELAELLGMKNNTAKSGLNSFAISQEVLIRTYSAGGWFGRLCVRDGGGLVGRYLNCRPH